MTPLDAHRRMYGDPRLPLAFWLRVQVAAPDDCWNWIGAREARGYGRFTWSYDRARRRTLCMVSHRFLYRTLIADPGELQIDHLCRNKSCVNPTHLEAVTASENARRSFLYPRGHRSSDKTHCVNGHEFTPENTYMHSPGRGRKKKVRRCRECIRVRNQRRSARAH